MAPVANGELEPPLWLDGDPVEWTPAEPIDDTDTSDSSSSRSSGDVRVRAMQARGLMVARAPALLRARRRLMVELNGPPGAPRKPPRTKPWRDHACSRGRARSARRRLALHPVRVWLHTEPIADAGPSTQADVAVRGPMAPRALGSRLLRPTCCTPQPARASAHPDAMASTQPLIEHHDVPQGSPEWHALRRTRITGTALGALIGAHKYESTNVAMRKLLARWAGRPEEERVNAAMERGKLHEPDGARFYADEYLPLARERWGDTLYTAAALAGYTQPRECGFYVNAERPVLGASPDRLVGKKGLLEVKVPFGKMYEPGALAAYYVIQVYLQMYVTGAEWADLVAWQPPWKHPQGDTTRDQPYRGSVWRIRFDDEFWHAVVLPAVDLCERIASHMHPDAGDSADGRVRTEAGDKLRQAEWKAAVKPVVEATQRWMAEQMPARVQWLAKYERGVWSFWDDPVVEGELDDPYALERRDGDAGGGGGGGGGRDDVPRPPPPPRADKPDDDGGGGGSAARAPSGKRHNGGDGGTQHEDVAGDTSAAAAPLLAAARACVTPLLVRPACVAAAAVAAAAPARRPLAAPDPGDVLSASMAQVDMDLCGPPEPRRQRSRSQVLAFATPSRSPSPMEPLPAASALAAAAVQLMERVEATPSPSSQPPPLPLTQCFEPLTFVGACVLPTTEARAPVPQRARRPEIVLLRRAVDGTRA